MQSSTIDRPPVVFYSWQSDLPNNENRGLIRKALEKTGKELEAELGQLLRVDEATRDVPGAPDISSTIFRKIANADMFLADVTPIGKVGNRETPNPNVLIELGYALHALGSARVIMVNNLSSGAIESLPFDIARRRIVPYESTTLVEGRRKLASSLVRNIRKILAVGLHVAPIVSELRHVYLEWIQENDRFIRFLHEAVYPSMYDSPNWIDLAKRGAAFSSLVHKSADAVRFTDSNRTRVAHMDEVTHSVEMCMVTLRGAGDDDHGHAASEVKKRYANWCVKMNSCKEQLSHDFAQP